MLFLFKFHFMYSGRHWSHISKTMKRIVTISRHASFQHISLFLVCNNSRLITKYSSKTICIFVWLFEASWCLQRWTYLVLGVMDTSRNSEIMKVRGLGVSPIMKSKSYSSQMEQNNSTELLGDSFNNVYNGKDPPQTPRPQNCILFCFPGFSMGNRHLFCVCCDHLL